MVGIVDVICVDNCAVGLLAAYLYLYMCFVSFFASVLIHFMLHLTSFALKLCVI